MTNNVSSVLTLSPWLVAILAGLALLGTAVFITQATASSHVAALAPDSRGLALGIYSTCYYIGGSLGGALPSLFWSRGGWDACVGFIITVQITMLSGLASMFWIGKARARQGKTEEAKAFMVENLRRYIAEPKREAVERWVSHVPVRFRFAVKLWRGITQYKKLKGAGEYLRNFLEVFRTGCVEGIVAHRERGAMHEEVETAEPRHRGVWRPAPAGSPSRSPRAGC